MKTKLGRPAKWRNRTEAMRLPEFMKELLMELSKIGDEEGYEMGPDKNILYKKGGVLETVAQVIQNKTGYFVQKSKESSKKVAGQKTEKARDIRLDHPAIVAFRRVSSRYPDKVLFDDVIHLLGNSPDTELMNLCFVEAAKRSLTHRIDIWLFEWFPKGGPSGGSANGAKNGAAPVANKYANRR